MKVIEKIPRKRKRITGPTINVEIAPVELRGMGLHAGGQSGDIQALPASEELGPESVKELVEEGQDFEAEVINGMGSVPDPDQVEVRSRRIREDDLPPLSPENE